MKKIINTRYIKDELCEIRFGRYPTGELAISLHDSAHGEPIAKVTVSAEPYDCPVIDHDKEIYLKDYSENIGMLEAMRVTGIITKATHCYPMARVEVYRCTLTEEAITEMQRQQRAK